MKDFIYDAMVTDANQRVALELIRALGMAKLKILVVERGKHTSKPIAFVSKHASATIFISDYTGSDFLMLCEKCRTVFPVSTNTILECCKSAVLKYPEKFLLPDLKLLKRVNDKKNLAKIAKNAGVPYPDTLLISNENNLSSNAGKIGFPLVLKLSNDEGLFLPPNKRYAIVENETALFEAYASLQKYNKAILMQEYINGIGVGFSTVYDISHNSIIEIQHQRLREYPATGGPSTFCKSVNFQKVKNHARKLLDSLQWVGPAMVEFKYEPTTGKTVLMEVNPRYWGSLPLARKAGINIPLAHYQSSVLMKTNYNTNYKENIKVKFVMVDFISAMKGVFSIRGGASGIFKYIFEFFDFSLYFGIWDWRDPRPAFRYFFNHLK